MTSMPPGGCQLARSACCQAIPGWSAAARASISAELSTPATRAAGQRWRSSAVTLPGPQPKSSTVPGASRGTRASRSRAGRRRKSPKARYWAGFQGMAGSGLAEGRIVALRVMAPASSPEANGWNRSWPPAPGPLGCNGLLDRIRALAPRLYPLIADALVLAHLLFIAFVVGGGFLLVRWPRLAWAHLPAAAWGATVEFAGWVCPLTPLENHFRRLAGSGAYGGDFVERYLVPLIYPAELTRVDQIVLGGVVVAVNGLAYGLAWWKWRRRGW